MFASQFQILADHEEHIFKNNGYPHNMQMHEENHWLPVPTDLCMPHQLQGTPAVEHNNRDSFKAVRWWPSLANGMEQQLFHASIVVLHVLGSTLLAWRKDASTGCVCLTAYLLSALRSAKHLIYYPSWQLSSFRSTMLLVHPTGPTP